MGWQVVPTPTPSPTPTPANVTPNQPTVTTTTSAGGYFTYSTTNGVGYWDLVPARANDLNNPLPSFRVVGANLDQINLLESLITSGPTGAGTLNQFLVVNGARQHPATGDDAKMNEDPTRGTTILIQFYSENSDRGGFFLGRTGSELPAPSGSGFQYIIKDRDAWWENGDAPNLYDAYGPADAALYVNTTVQLTVSGVNAYVIDKTKVTVGSNGERFTDVTNLNAAFFQSQGLTGVNAYLIETILHELVYHPSLNEGLSVNGSEGTGHPMIFDRVLRSGGTVEVKTLTIDANDIRRDPVENALFLELQRRGLFSDPNGTAWLATRVRAYQDTLSDWIAEFKRVNGREPTIADLNAADKAGTFDRGSGVQLRDIIRGPEGPMVVVRNMVDSVITGVTTIDGGQLGYALGSVLGKRLTTNPFGQIIASGVLSTVLGTVGEFIDEEVFGGTSTWDIVDNVERSFGASLLANIKGAGIGALSSFLTAQLFEAVGLDGLPGDFGKAVGGAYVTAIIKNLPALVNGSKQLKDVLGGVNVPLVIGSFIGSKLASEIWTPQSVGGQIGAAVGGLYGGFAATAALSAAAASAGIEGGALAFAVANPIVAIAIVAAVVLIDTLLGGLIGSLFGGTPRSGADTVWDPGKGEFGVANVYARMGGSKDAARNLATMVAGNFNAVLEVSGSTLLDPRTVQAGNYGMRAQDYVYRPYSTDDKNAITARFKGKDAAQSLVTHGTYLGLSDMVGQLAGGDIYVKRAVAASLANAGGNPNSNAAGAAGQFDMNALVGDMTAARDYSAYLDNTQMINALIAADPRSAFAAGWVITLARAVELGLNRRSYTDWIGGYATFLDEAANDRLDGVELNAALIGFEIDETAGIRHWSVLDSFGAVYGTIRDSVEAGSSTVIGGTSGSDTIRLAGNQLLATSGGTNVGLTVEGVAHNGTAKTLPVTATVDAGGGNDTVQASDLGDNVFGGTGDDTIWGGRLDDWLLGGDGNDVINAGGAGTGTLGGNGNYLSGGAGDDLLIGREGSDWLEGGDGIDTLEGGDGGDILAGGGGTGDVMRGGRGDDQYIFRKGDAVDTVRDESGLSVEQVVGQAFVNQSAGTVTTRIAQALTGELFRVGSGLNQWAGGGVQATSQGTAAGGEDTLALGVGIGLDDIKISRSADGKDLIIELWPDGIFSGDRVTLADWFSSFNKIETLQFADGNQVRIADFDTFILGSDGAETIIGTAGNDFVHAGAGNDVIYLLSGNDFGNGGLGDDTVSGDSGNDIVLGSDGIDTLIGGLGADMVSGGRGADRLTGDGGNDVLTGGAGEDEVVGGTGDDVFKYQRGDGRDTFVDALTDEWQVVWVSGTGFSAGYTLNADGTITHSTAGVIYDGSKWAANIRYDMEQGTLWRHAPANAAVTVMSSGTDTIEFNLGIDINDIRFAQSGNDIVIGIETAGGSGEGFASLADQITLRNWASSVNTAARGSIEKFVFYNTGAVDVASTRLIGGTDGNDSALTTGVAGTANWVTGGIGDDIVTGAELNDILNGNAGQDRLLGALGSDALLGGAGNDVLIGGGGGTRDGVAAGDILIGGEGFDTASYETATAGVTASLSGATAGAGDAAGDSYGSVENLRGSDYADTLEGDTFENELTGGKGNDTLRGAGGDDVYTFGRGDGSDTIYDDLVAGETVIVGSDGQLQPPYVSSTQLVDREGSFYQFEHIVTNSETGEVVYRRQFDGAVGSYGPGYTGSIAAPSTFDPASWVRNDDGSARFGVSGSKVSFATSYAGAGNDTILFEDYTGNPGVTGDAAIALSDLTFSFSGNDLVISVNGSGGTLTLKNFKTSSGLNAAQALERLQFSDGSEINLAGLKFDPATGALLAASTDTSAAPVDDLIVTNATTAATGNYGNDTLLGGAAANLLQGGEGDDLLVGGLGADNLQGGAGLDTASYAGSDVGVTVDLSLTTAQATVSGAESSGDILSSVEIAVGSQYADTITGSVDDNRLRGLRGNDVLSGGAGSGELKGLGADVLIGDDGDDTLAGGVHEDNLDGGTGNDILEGGGDRDVLAGGDGNDILRGDQTTTGGTVETADEVGGNLSINNSFETGTGATVADLPGWTSSAARPFALVTSGVTGMTGARALKLDDGTGNVAITQTIEGLSAGEVLKLSFSSAALAAGATSGLEVLWNGQLIALTPNTSSSTFSTVTVAALPPAVQGTNTLTFRATGTVDGLGAVIDNVSLTRTAGGADQLNGGAGSDRLLGGGGDDVLIGGDGDDLGSIVLSAGATPQTIFAAGLYGGAGNDILDGGTGNDTLDGGAGNDTYVLRAGYGQDSITIGGGQDDIVFSQIASNQLWLRQVGNDLEITTIGLGTVALVKNWFVSASGEPNQARRIVAADKVLARADVAALVTAMASVSTTVPAAYPATPPTAFTEAWQDAATYEDHAILVGTSSVDTLAPDALWVGPVVYDGQAGADVINAGSTDDTLIGGAGADTLNGGDGDDSFLFDTDASYDTVAGGDGLDRLFATVANARINLAAMSGIEEISANGFAGVQLYNNPTTTAGATVTLDLSAITLTGIAQINGNDSAGVIETIVGSAGSDTISALAGDDTVSGGLGNDIISGGLGTDILDGGDGQDTLDQSFETASTTTQVINLAVATAQTIQTTKSGVTTTETAKNFEHVFGGAGDDAITGSAGTNRIEGRGGNDTLDGSDGNDLLTGGLGADTLKGGTGSDVASYRDSSAGVNVNLATNTLAGTGATLGDAAGDKLDSIENLYGSAFADTLTGDQVGNVLLGLQGNDTLDGDNSVVAGAGADTAAYLGNRSDYEIITNAGVTTVRDLNTADGIDEGLDTLTDIEFLQFADAVVNLGIDSNNGPRLGQPPMADQVWADNGVRSYQIPATAFFDLDLGDGMAYAATLADGSALPSWLTFNATNRTFSGTPPVASIGTVIEVKVTATDASGAGLSVSDNFLISITAAAGANLAATAGTPLAGTFRAENMTGSTGNDIFVGSAGADRIDGLASTPPGGDLVDYSASTAGVTVDLTTGVGSGGDAEGDLLISIEEVTGSAFDDTLTGTAGGDKLNGKAGMDRIDGGGGDDLIKGGADVDTLNGGDGSDSIYARALADGSLEDRVDGGGGQDTIYLGESGYGAIVNLSASSINPVSVEHVVGSDYADTITGNEYANILSGGLGNDTVRGGYGADTLHGDGGNDVVEGGDGNDNVYGDDGDDRLVGGVGADKLYGGAGIDTADYRASLAGVTVNLATGTATGGDAQGDQFADGLVENVDGSDLADTVTGSAAVNVLKGFAGNDLIQGGLGNDSIDGGSGIDRIVFAGNRADYVIDFVARTIRDANTANGDEGTDTYLNVELAQFADMSVNLTDPVVVTPLGNLSRVDNASFTYVVPTGTFNDPDGNQSDAYKGLTLSATLTSGAALPAWLSFNAATKTFSYSSLAAPIGTVISIRVTATDGTASATSDFTLTITEGPGATITGTAAGETINGTFRAEAINALDGNDRVNGSLGADAIDGGLGTDWVSYGSSAAGVTISLAGGAGTGGDAAGDTLANVENLGGSALADTLTGSTAANLIDAGAGNDTVNAGDGADTVSGGDGTDTLRGEAGDDTISGGAGADVHDGGAGTDYASYYWLNTGLVVTQNMTGVTADLATVTNNTGIAAGDTYIAIEGLIGSVAADTLRGDSGANVLMGQEGNDTLAGNDGVDTLYGGDGIDTITGGVGADLVYGEAGDDTVNALAVGEDTIDGGAGIDTASFAGASAALAIDLTNAAHKLTNVENVIGGTGGDTLTGSSAANRLDGGDGNDTIQGGAGGDVLIGGLGTDMLTYAASGVGTTFQSGSIGQSTVNSVVVAAAVNLTLNGVDVNLLANTATGADATGDTISGFENLTGSAYADRLRGTAANSTVSGGAGQDVVYGGAGDDWLYGDAGDDIIYGEAGIDHIYGGADNDRLFGEGAGDSLYGDAGNDLLDAGDAGDDLDGGTGDDILIGGLGEDHYIIRRNSGADTIYNFDDDSAVDSVSYDIADNVQYSELWFTKVGKDLRVKILGGTAVTTIKDWFATTTAGDWTAADNFYVDVFIAGSRVNYQVDLAKLLNVSQGVTEPASFSALTAVQRAQIENAWGQNALPTIVQVAGNPTSVNEDGSINLRFTVADAETPAANLSVVVTTDGVLQTVVPATDVRTIDATTREVTIRPVANASGSGNVRIRSFDNGLYSNELVVPIAVTAVADGVTLSAPSAVGGNTGTSISLAGIVASLLDSDEVLDMLQIEGLPAGAQLVSGANSATTSTVDIRTWNLSTLALLPGTSAADYTLTVRSRSREPSNSALSGYSTRTITVTVNGAPTAVNVTPVAFNENVAAATVATLSATDPDSGNSFTYAIVGGADAAKFTISGTTLSLASGQSLNFEAGPATIDIRVTDQGGLTYIRTGVQITATNVNEALGAVSDSNAAANTVADGAGAGTLVGVTASAVDPDGTAPTYSITGGNALGWFAINSATGVVSVASGATVQYETAQSVTLTLQASDGVTTPVTTNVTIAITDVNETPLITSAASASINENVTGPTFLRNLTSSDPDLAASANGTSGHVFSIVGGSSLFEIVNGNTLQTKSGVSFNYEATSSYAITLRVRDNSNTGLYYDQAFTVTINNVNETPTNIRDIDGALGGSVTEGVGGYTGVQVQADDQEGAGALTYSITGGNSSGWFSINSTTGQISASAAVNRESAYVTSGQVVLSVTATDAGGLSVSRSDVAVTIADVNEAPVFTSGTSATVSEAVAGPVFIATITTSDPDADTVAFGEAGQVLYISGGDTSKFQLVATANPNVKQLYTTAGTVLDYETATSYTLQFRAYDNNGNSGWTDVYQSFTVNIAPVDEAPSAPSATASSNSFTENSPYSVTISGSADPEGGDVTYNFASGGNPAGLFAIDNNATNSATLRLTTGGQTVDYEAVKANPTGYGIAYLDTAAGYARWDVKVVGTDPGGTSSGITTVSVYVYNQNEAPTAMATSNANVSFAENLTGDTGVRFSASDPDGDAVSYYFSATGTQSYGPYQILNGNQLWITGNRDFENQPALSFNVYATANGQTSGAITQTVGITNVNDVAPTVTGITWLSGFSNGQVVENVPLGTAVGVVDVSDADTAGGQHSFTMGGQLANSLRVVWANNRYELQVWNVGLDYEALGGTSMVLNGPALSRSFSVTANDGVASSSAYSSNLSVLDLDIWVATPASSYPGGAPWVASGYLALGGQGGGGNNFAGGGSIFYDANGNGIPDENIQVGQYSFGGTLYFMGMGTNALTYSNITTNTPGYYVINPSATWTGSMYFEAPIVLDLDGDGLDLTSAVTSNVLFDQGADGTMNRTGWVAASDALLVLDRNGNGLIDNASEISFIGDKAGAKTDLEGLAGLDSNGDGRISALDTRYADLQVWQDLDQDGVSDAGELRSLAAAGVTAIVLGGTATTGAATSIAGNAVYNTTRFLRPDGSDGLVGDVGLAYFAAQGDAMLAAPLAFDADGNGVIEPASEVAMKVSQASAFDSNGNGRIEPGDARYYDLRVWNDANANGRAEPDELAGIDVSSTPSIDLRSAAPTVTPTPTPTEQTTPPAPTANDDSVASPHSPTRRVLEARDGSLAMLPLRTNPARLGGLRGAMAGASWSGSNGALTADRRVLGMTQAMASFAARGGEGDLGNRDRNVGTTTDWFAGAA